MPRTPLKIRRKLMALTFSTVHATDVKNNTIAHLLSYEKSLSAAQINLSALFSVCQCLAWLLKHIEDIDDRRVLPSEQMFLADALGFCLKAYERHKNI